MPLPKISPARVALVNRARHINPLLRTSAPVDYMQDGRAERCVLFTTLVRYILKHGIASEQPTIRFSSYITNLGPQLSTLTSLEEGFTVNRSAKSTWPSLGSRASRSANIASVIK